MSSTRVSRRVYASRAIVYRALPGGGTDVLAVHDGLPRGVPSADNEAGWREALAKLAALLEAGYK